MHVDDKDAQWWEKLIQYKSTIYEDKRRTLGARFVMFYNAGGINPASTHDNILFFTDTGQDRKSVV